MKIELLGINVQRNPAWEKTFAILGFGDIGLPEIETTLRGCALAWSYGKLIALPPKIPGAHPGDLGAMSWNPSGKFAERVRDKLVEGYRALGGAMPPEPTVKQQAGASAARRVAERPQPIERRVFPVSFTVHDEASDAEAVEGLARTLSVEQEEVRRVIS